MLALAQKIHHGALGHYRAAMEDHNTWEMIPTWKGGDNTSCCDKSSFKSQFINHIFRVHQRATGPMKVPFFTNIQGLCQDVFHQAKEKKKKGSKWNELTQKDDLGLKNASPYMETNFLKFRKKEVDTSAEA